MLKQVRNLCGLTFFFERIAAIILAPVSGKLRKQLEQQAGDMRRVASGVLVRVRHLHYQLNTMAVIEQDLNYFHAVTTPLMLQASRKYTA